MTDHYHTDPAAVRLRKRKAKAAKKRKKPLNLWDVMKKLRWGKERKARKLAEIKD